MNDFPFWHRYQLSKLYGITNWPKTFINSKGARLTIYLNPLHFAFLMSMKQEYAYRKLHVYICTPLCASSFNRYLFFFFSMKSVLFLLPSDNVFICFLPLVVFSFQVSISYWGPYSLLLHFLHLEAQIKLKTFYQNEILVQNAANALQERDTRLGASVSEGSGSNFA